MTNIVAQLIAFTDFIMLCVLSTPMGVLLEKTGRKSILLLGLAIAFAGIILTGLNFANIFPLIFSIALDRLPERFNELSGLMVTAIGVGPSFR